ncbi:hypothetical protein DIPPA_03145 [Diplonema papillatum]|nr:hypothetical protein DIPPA_03145 [Diplonema papillatum]
MQTVTISEAHELAAREAVVEEEAAARRAAARAWPRAGPGAGAPSPRLLGNQIEHFRRCDIAAEERREIARILRAYVFSYATASLGQAVYDEEEDRWLCEEAADDERGEMLHTFYARVDRMSNPVRWRWCYPSFAACEAHEAELRTATILRESEVWSMELSDLHAAATFIHSLQLLFQHAQIAEMIEEAALHDSNGFMSKHVIGVHEVGRLAFIKSVMPSRQPHVCEEEERREELYGLFSCGVDLVHRLDVDKLEAVHRGHIAHNWKSDFRKLFADKVALHLRVLSEIERLWRHRLLYEERSLRRTTKEVERTWYAELVSKLVALKRRKDYKLESDPLLPFLWRRSLP